MTSSINCHGKVCSENSPWCVKVMLSYTAIPTHFDNVIRRAGPNTNIVYPVLLVAQPFYPVGYFLDAPVDASWSSGAPLFGFHDGGVLYLENVAISMTTTKRGAANSTRMREVYQNDNRTRTTRR